MAKTGLKWPQSSEGERREPVQSLPAVRVQHSPLAVQTLAVLPCSVLAVSPVVLRMAVPAGLVRQEQSQEH